MGRPVGNGLVEMVDEREDSSGWFCMDLVMLLTDAGMTDWDSWHGAFVDAEAGRCPFARTCERYARSVAKRSAKEEEERVKDAIAAEEERKKNGLQIEMNF